MDFFAEARQKIIIDSFYVAMTGIASDSDLNLQLDRNAKPIELYAHDPLRYVGDILAWLHSTAVSEQEALEVLFVATEQEPHSSIANRIQEGLKNELGIHSQYEDQQDDELDISSSLLGLVNKDLEPVSKPLRVS